MQAIVYPICFIIAGIIAFIILKRQGDVLFKKFAKWPLVAGIVIALAIFIPSVFVRVPAGHVSVATLFGKVSQTPLTEGLHVVNPLIKVHEMSIRVMRITGSYSAASRDMQDVTVTAAFVIALNPKKSPYVYSRVGTDSNAYIRSIVDPAVQEILKSETALLDALQILQKRPILKAKIQSRLIEWLTKYGVVLHEVSISNIKFNQEYQAAIERKQVQQQKVQEQKYRLERRRIEVQTMIMEANGQAQARIAKAKGLRDATILAAEGIAKKNFLIGESLRKNPLLISWEYLKTWNGRLPLYLVHGGGGQGNKSAIGLLFNVPLPSNK